MNFVIVSLYLLEIFLPFCSAGTIKTSGTFPIANSIANCNQFSDYTFNFIVETAIPAGGLLVITFPPQYNLGLGIPLPSTSSCSVSCSISQTTRSVTLTYPNKVYNGSAYNVSIYGILNPTLPGGTGMFIFQSYTGQNLLDVNYIFGVIGIASAVNLLTNAMVNLKSGGVSTAGAYTTYLFTFKTASYTPWNSFIKLTIPVSSGFVLNKFPACSAYPIYNVILPGVLTCETTENEIMITGFNDNIQAGTDCGILISMQNPSFSTTTDVFKIAIYRGGTKFIYDWVNDIAGVEITAGSISGISLKKINPYAYQTMNKVQDYQLKFTLVNKLTTNSVISIIFPATFVIAVSTSYDLYFVNYGLEDISEKSTVYLNVVSPNKILISNFQNTSPNTEIALTLRMINPNSNGYTTPLKIITYTNSSQSIIVDQDLVSAKTTIELYTSSSGILSIIASNPLANREVTDLLFFIQPDVTIPAGGYFKIRVPDDFQLIIPFVATNCQLDYSGVSGTNWKNAQGCVVSGNVITIWNQNDLAFIKQTLGSFRVLAQVLTPTYNSTFLFDIETYDVDGVRMLESYSHYLIITANSIITSQVTVFGNSQKKTILDVSFNTRQTLPSGGPQYRASDVKGRIELIFLTTGWSTSLGTNLANGENLTCKAITGIVGIDGNEISCQIMVDILPRITVSNFQSIPANTPVRFHILYLNPPSGTNTHTVKLSIISLQNRICSNLNEIILSFTISALGAVGTTNSQSISYTSSKVNTNFDLTFMPFFGNVVINDYILVILPSYDTKFIQLNQIISCSVKAIAANDFTSLPCIPYYGVDWILIQTPIALTNTATLKITNLIWPRYVQTLSTNLCFKTAVFSNTNNQYRAIDGACSTPIISPNANNFNLAMISAPKKGLGYVDCTYTFTFNVDNKIPDNSKIVLTFPSSDSASYSLIESSPVPIFSAPLLVGYNGGSLQFSTTINQLTVSNVGEYPAGSTFTIVADGIKNPVSGIISSGWNIEIYYSGNLVNSQLDFFSFPFGPAFTSGYVIINQISAFPINADEYADFTIVFTPQTDIPNSGLISVTFPANQYKELPGNLDCVLSGGIQTFTSCILSSTTVKIVTGEKYTAGVGSIYLKIKNIKNPDAGTTDGFLVTTSYDGVTLDITDQTSLSGRTFTSFPKAQTITVTSLTFDPQNEGEESTYNFTFVPSNFIDSNNYILIQYPDDYHPTLGRSIECATYSGLIGEISCSVSNRGVYVTNFQTYLPSADKPIGILVYGVINPNVNSAKSTGYFIIGVQIGTTAAFQDYNSQAGVVSVLSAPGWATLYNLTTSNTYARITSTYSFDFNAVTKVPKTSSLGKIYVDYPSQFSISDGVLTCDTPTNDFAYLITCSISRNRVSIEGQTADYSGGIIINLYSVLNPIIDGKCDNINIRTYDGMNKKIIERSFDNIDPFSFTYSYPGPLIIVNNGNDIIVERGTQTPDLYFTFDYPSRLNITIKPYVPGFSLIPYDSDISVGMLRKKFRVSIPMNFYDGDYYLIWSTLNDLNAYYTPLKQTKVMITKTGINPLSIENVLDVPFGGQSLMTFITSLNSPDIGITIKVNFVTQYKGMTLNKNVIDMNPGSNSVNFTIFSSSDPNELGTSSQKGTISFILEGVNKDIYQLPFSSYSFLMVASDTVAPLLQSFTLYNYSQTNVFLSISVNEPVHMYYMYALAGTIAPPLSEIKSMGPAAHNTTVSVYGFAVLRDSSKTPFLLEIDGLNANIDYVIYAYFEDRGINVNSIPYNLSFSTADIFSAADFSIKLNQPSSDTYDVFSICDSIAFVLSLEREKVIERQYILSSSGRILASTSATIVSTTINLQILPMPNNPDFPSPEILASSLINKTTELEARISNFDSTYDIPYSSVLRYKPKFIGTALLNNYTYYSANFSLILNNYGWGYIIAIKESDDASGVYPSPYQISLGYNQSNILVDNYGFVEVTEGYTLFKIYINNLESETIYNAYISAGSANPGYPDMIDKKYVQKLRFITNVAPPIEKLDINGTEQRKAFFWKILSLMIMVCIAS